MSSQSRAHRLGAGDKPPSNHWGSAEKTNGRSWTGASAGVVRGGHPREVTPTRDQRQRRNSQRPRNETKCQMSRLPTETADEQHPKLAGGLVLEPPHWIHSPDRLGRFGREYKKKIFIGKCSTRSQTAIT